MASSPPQRLAISAELACVFVSAPTRLRHDHGHGLAMTTLLNNPPDSGPPPRQIRFVHNQGQPPSKRRRINAAYVLLDPLTVFVCPAASASGGEWLFRIEQAQEGASINGCGDY